MQSEGFSTRKSEEQPHAVQMGDGLLWYILLILNDYYVRLVARSRAVAGLSSSSVSGSITTP